MANTTIQLRKSGVTGNIPATLNYGELALNYDAVREELPANVCATIEAGILRDPLANRHKIRTNFPLDWHAILTLKAVLGLPWREELEDVLERASARAKG